MHPMLAAVERQIALPIMRDQAARREQEARRMQSLGRGRQRTTTYLLSMSTENTSEPKSREPRPHLAARHRLAALAASWRSSALWKMHDAEMADDEDEAIACRREATTFEICASNVEAWIREF